jgi:hypothetical protein
MFEIHGGSLKSIADWENVVVPFVIEREFKDPRFLVYENKPVVGIYSYSALRSQLGDADKAIAFLDQACKDAGFDGVIVVAYFDEEGTDYKCFYGQKFDVNKDDPKYINSPSCNYEDAAWRKPCNSSGLFRPAEKFKKLLQGCVDELLNKEGLASKMLLIATWNEYGEGHFIMPTEGLGYRYLDVIGDILGPGPGKHENIAPTENQQNRLDLLFSRLW